MFTGRCSLTGRPRPSVPGCNYHVFACGVVDCLQLHFQDAWFAAHPNLHRIFSITGVTILNLAPDLMHVKHLGTRIDLERGIATLSRASSRPISVHRSLIHRPPWPHHPNSFFGVAGDSFPSFKAQTSTITVPYANCSHTTSWAALGRRTKHCFGNNCQMNM